MINLRKKKKEQEQKRTKKRKNKETIFSKKKKKKEKNSGKMRKQRKRGPKGTLEGPHDRRPGPKQEKSLQRYQRYYLKNLKKPIKSPETLKPKP